MKAGIVLSGCGVKDGTEIHETVLTMLHLDRLGAQIVCAAPDADQAQVVNHVSGQVCGAEERNILLESELGTGAVLNRLLRIIRDLGHYSLEALVHLTIGAHGGIEALFARLLKVVANLGMLCHLVPRVRHRLGRGGLITPLIWCSAQ